MPERLEDTFKARCEAAGLGVTAAVVAAIDYWLGGDGLGVEPKPLRVGPTAASVGLARSRTVVAEAKRKPFVGITALGEPLPERKPYQKTGKRQL